MSEPVIDTRQLTEEASRQVELMAQQIESDPYFSQPISARKTHQALFYFQWSGAPRIAILLGFLRLPYDILRFCITGKAYFIQWPWKW